ncbi:2-polyprenyl-6-methoxyphenol hydroxylase-like FAD-dependent oxidoreductase [Mucilaginibacter oryzae]|uniref:2-polyprenyl-6-methoxyphenol hydroxylase-like FAD-dependent oxidoreductase n=1 Tax=Mucilaginibacter oryzae TaxID=468058 RepID=A0A316H9D1_9SPHI|nr:FAD-dependent monooxygenase [Mucilaginibacter oryzae]PWK76610.1 2-polyprenyl-6-methoxyphenol hydroxylase-like FAD-dependent oxidoreductase [Mucilaginibacter oryzae]
MTITQQHTEVFIVGAGPSGLMMAAQLLRYGVQPLIIDSRQGPTSHSKALAVQARSLEIYRQMGVVDKILAEGKQAGGAKFNNEGAETATLTLANVGEGQTPYPFIQMYPQSKNERLLLDFLTLNCCPVYWDTTLVSFSQNKGGLGLQLQTGNQLQNIACNWLIGADGAHSAVRKQLNIPFNGDTYPHQFYLADIKIANKLGNDVDLFLSKQGFAGFFPMPDEDNYRVVGNLPESFDHKENLQIEDILPHLEAVMHQPLRIEQVNWFTTYKLHQRKAEKFREQRCFLIGDAAHIHSPVGGQGMNTGLQDAYNLAWKLAGVVNNQLQENILESYAAERMPVAKELLSTTDRLFKIILSQNWFISLLKHWLLPVLLKWAWAKPKLRDLFFKRVSQTGISYRDSQISLHLSQSTRIKAGDRLPYLKVFDEKRQQETDLHEWCAKPGFTLICLGKLKELDLFTVAKWITQKYGANLNFFYLPPSARNQHIFDAFDIREGQKKALIIRPDMHIGFLNDVVDIDMMDNYLLNVVRFLKSEA